MKGFFVRHGEKLFLVVVALIAGWSLFQSLKSLGTTEHVSEADKSKIEKIARELATKKAPPKVPAPYVDWLQANLDGHGIYALTVGKFPSPRVYEPPFETTTVGPTITEVPGRIPLPAGLEAEPHRAKITFSWTAPTASNMRILKFEVYRRKEGGAWGAEPVYTGTATSFEDRNLSPETEYAYKVRVVGVADTSDETRKVIPQSPPLVKQGSVWLTAFVGDAGNVSAMTPSNVDFECSNVFTRFGEKYANIVIKRWDSKQDKWLRFKTTPGIRVGDKVIGVRRYGRGNMLKETFDSGYILKQIVDEIRKIEVIREILVEDPPGSGIVVKKTVKTLVPKRVQEIILEKADGSQKITVPVGKGKSIHEKKSKPEDKPKDKKKPAGGLDDFKKLFESSGGRSDPAKPSGGEKRPVATAPRAAPAVTLAQARTAMKLTFPDGWVATGDMAGDLGVGRAWSGVLQDGKAAVYKGTVPNSGVVIADKPFGEEDKRRLMPNLKKGASDASVLESLAVGVQRSTGNSLVGVEGYEPLGGIEVSKTAAGKAVSSYSFAFTDGQAKSVVKRYFALSADRMYALAFVCLEKDLESQQKVFDEMVSSWTW